MGAYKKLPTAHMETPFRTTLFESLLAPKSNPLLAVELPFAKQGSMDSGEFHAHVVKIAKRCRFPALRQKKELSGTQFS